MSTSSKTAVVSSNFSVGFSVDATSNNTGDLKLEADSDFNKTLPGSTERFYLFKRNVKDIRVFSTLGNLNFLGTVTLQQSESVSVTGAGSLSTKYDITTLNNVVIIGTPYNYGGIDLSADGVYEVKKADESLDYVLATLYVDYIAVADHYELTHTKPQSFTNGYEIGILALGINTL